QRWLVVPVMVTPDHDSTVVVVAVAIPSAVQAAVVLIESHARAAIVTVAVITAVAAHIDAEPAGACRRRNGDGEGCQFGAGIRELLHCSSPLVCYPRENECRRALLWGTARNFLERVFTTIATL